MTIDTKFKIGDEVWVRPTNYIEKGIIESIDVSARMEYGIITRKCISYGVKIDNYLFVFMNMDCFPLKKNY